MELSMHVILKFFASRSATKGDACQSKKATKVERSNS